MKLNFLYTFFAILFGSFLFFSSSEGRAGAQSSGNTGAPGDNSETYQTCHNNGSFAVTPVLEVFDGQTAVNFLLPNKLYTVRLTVNSTGSPNGYGFQILALNEAQGIDGLPVNGWFPIGAGVSAVTLNTGRQYLEHNSISTSNEFQGQWTSPSGGKVTFYYGGNAVNQNAATSGDNAIMGSMEFDVGIVSTNELEQKVSLNIFPNPVNEVLNLKTNSDETGTYDLTIYDLSGKLMMYQKIEIPSGEKVSVFDVTNFSAGMYNLILSDGKNQLVKKILKQ